MPAPRLLRRAHVAASATALAQTACGGGDEGGASAATDATGAPSDAAVEEVDLSDVTLRVADQLGGLEVPLRISGQLDDVPYEIEWSSFASGPLVNEAIAAGEVDLGPMGDTPAILSAASGLDTVVGAVRETSGPGATIVARPGSGIETLEALEGHSLAYTTGTSAHGFVLRALDSVGLAEDDIEQVDVPITDVATVLANEDADAAALYEVFRPAYVAEHPDAAELISLGDIIPTYNFLLAPRDRLADPAVTAAIEDLVGRLARAGAWVQEHEDEFIEAYYVGELHQDPAIARSVYEAQGDSVWVEPSADIQEVQQQQADLLFEAGRIPEEVDLTSQFDPELTTRFTTAIQEALQ